MRWTIALGVGFAIMVAANAVYIWAALSVAAEDGVVQSYTERAGERPTSDH